MDFNRSAIEEKMIRASAYLNLKRSGFLAVRDWILETREFYAIPHSVSEMDIDDSKLDRIETLCSRPNSIVKSNKI